MGLSAAILAAGLIMALRGAVERQMLNRAIQIVV
jgi:hypothetical protein